MLSVVSHIWEKLTYCVMLMPFITNMKITMIHDYNVHVPCIFSSFFVCLVKCLRKHEYCGNIVTKKYWLFCHFTTAKNKSFILDRYPSLTWIILTCQRIQRNGIKVIYCVMDEDWVLVTKPTDSSTHKMWMGTQNLRIEYTFTNVYIYSWK